MEDVKTGLLDGKKEISEFLNGQSEYMLKKYIKAGMPVRFVDGRWLAHKANLEEFFKKYTKTRSSKKEIPE